MTKKCLFVQTIIRKYGLEKWAKEYSKKVTESYFKGDFPVDM
jgi:hypothetical protein